MMEKIRQWLTSGFEIISTIGLVVLVFVFIYWLSPRDFIWLVGGIAVLTLLAGIAIFLEKHPALSEAICKITDSFTDLSGFFFKQHALFFKRYAITIFLSAFFIIAGLFGSWQFSRSPNFFVIFFLISLLWIIRGIFQIMGDWLRWRAGKKAATGKNSN